jgi:hypothetical protein
MTHVARLAGRITQLLSDTRQQAYEPAVVAETAALICGRGADWTALTASPASLAELPLSVAGCLLAFAAALDEADRPELTAVRLEREAARLDGDRDYHLRRAAELARTAESAGLAHRRELLDQRAAHAECARRDAERAASHRAFIARRISPETSAA